VAPPIFSEWTRQRVSLDAALLTIMLIQAALAGGWTTAAWPLLAANKHRAIAAWSLANALVTIGCAAALSRSFGVRGAAFGALVADFFFGFLPFPTLTALFLGVEIRTIYLQIARTIVGFAPALAAGVALQRFLPGWWTVAAFVAVAPVITYPMLRLCFRPEDLDVIRTRMRIFRRTPGMNTGAPS
jgi:hypothetical protein